MKLSNVNVVNPNQVGVKDVKTAAKVATAIGGANLLGSVASDVFAQKHILKLAAKEPEIVKELYSKSAEEFLALSKDIFQGMIPKPFSGLLNKSVEATPKNIKKFDKALKEIADNVASGKINYKPILKRGAKTGAIATAVVAGVVLAGTLISKAIQAKKDTVVKSTTV